MVRKHSYQARVFHATDGVADAELAGLLRSIAQGAYENPGLRQAAKILGGVAVSLDPLSGTQHGSADADPSVAAEVRDVLAAGLERARSDQHPATDRLAAVADRWDQFAAAAADELAAVRANEVAR